jgi:hypothetical protein
VGLGWAGEGPERAAAVPQVVSALVVVVMDLEAGRVLLVGVMAMVATALVAAVGLAQMGQLAVE